jgi:hypothetical protein
MAKQYASEPILVVGGTGNQCREVAESYGFKNVYIPLDLVRWRPEIWPFKRLSDKEKSFVKVCVGSIKQPAVLRRTP